MNKRFKEKKHAVKLVTKRRINIFMKVFLRTQSHISSLNKPIVEWKTCEFCIVDMKNSKLKNHTKSKKPLVSFGRSQIVIDEDVTQKPIIKKQIKIQ